MDVEKNSGLSVGHWKHKRNSQEKPIRKENSKSFFKKHKKLIIGFLILLTLLGIFVWSFLSPKSSISFAIEKVLPGNPIKSTDDKVNILMLGNAGGRHDGPLLTDTIIVASYNLKTDKVVLISVPRDLWLGNLKAKVNAAYETGEKRGEGLEYAKRSIGDVLGIPLHYGVRIDFSGFEKAVDLVGGVDIEVPRTFDDYNYPIEGEEDNLCGNEEKEVEVTEEMAKALKTEPGKKKLIFTTSGKVASESADFACRFERIHFDKGKTEMNGAIALKFVRSRMGTNGEGSDFARSRRQQLVIQAFKDKILSVEVLANIQKLSELVTILGKSFETDIPKERFLNFYNLSKKLKTVESIVLGDLGNGKSLFVNPPTGFYGAWVLIPPEEDWTLVADFVRDVLSKSEKEKK